MKSAQKSDLPLPKRLTSKHDCRLVRAHPPRITTGKKDGGKSHADKAITWARLRELTVNLAASRFRAMILS
jgi:hypothetical protein